MNRVFIVRHGNTFAAGAPPRRIGARTDLPLVASGVNQSRALAAWFVDHEIRFARTLVSGLSRTRATAELILLAQHRPAQPIIVDALREIDHGPDENQLEAAVEARIGKAALAAWNTDGHAPDGWQVDHDARVAWWRTFLADPGMGDSLVVTSAGAARFALPCCWSELPPNSSKLRTGAFGIVRCENGCSPHLLAWDMRP